MCLLFGAKSLYMTIFTTIVAMKTTNLATYRRGSEEGKSGG
jgi:hypothetical protein